MKTLDIDDKYEELVSTIARTNAVTQAILTDFLDNSGERNLSDHTVATLLWQVEKNLETTKLLADGIWQDHRAATAMAPEEVFPVLHRREVTL